MLTTTPGWLHARIAQTGARQLCDSPAVDPIVFQVLHTGFNWPQGWHELEHSCGALVRAD
jgi:hypothetical protein